MVYNCYRIAEVFVVRKKVFIYVKLNCFAPYLIFTYIIHINMYLRENSNLKHLKTKLYQIYRSSQMIWMEYSYALENFSIVFVAKRKKKNFCARLIIISLFVKNYPMKISSHCLCVTVYLIVI